MKDKKQQEFINILYSEYYNIIKNYCMAHMGNDPYLRDQIPDTIQTVFEIAIKKYHKIAASENVGGWLMKTCQNVILTLKKRYAKQKSVIATSIDSATCPENLMRDTVDQFELWYSQMEKKEDLARILEILSTEEAEILYEYVISDKTAAQIAQEKSVTVGTIKAILYRMRKKVRSKFVH